MFLNRNKLQKTIIGTFKDEKGMTYHLMKEKSEKKRDGTHLEQEKEDICFYKGKERILPWNVHILRLNLSQSNPKEVKLFVKKYLQTSSNIKNCLYSMKFPMESVLEI